MRRILITKTVILLPAIHRFHAFPVELPMTFHTGRTIISNIYTEPCTTRESCHRFEREARVGGITNPDRKLCYVATLPKAVCYWQKNRHTDQWDRTESPAISARPYGPLKIRQRGQKHNVE